MTDRPAPAKLSTFTLMMINVAAILSLRSLPGLAEYGYALLFYLGLASVGFFIPSALVSAELASGWQGQGGVYLWVREAFGPRWGFVAVFMQWVENLPWFPAVLAFAASAFAYMFHPPLAESKWFVVGFIWLALWGGTLLNLRGMKLSALLSSTGAIGGTIIPGLLVIALSIQYLASGQPAAIEFSPAALVPDLASLDQLMLLAAMMICFSGMEMSAVHVKEVRRPERTYPRAIFAACGLILLLSIVGSLAIAVVIPQSQLSLSAGVCEAFDKLFTMHAMPWATTVICALMTYGALTMVITWMVGPSKGLREVAREGYLPTLWQKINAAGMPVNIMLIQTAVSCLLSCAILFMPTVSSAFMLMSALAAQLYLIMYILLFAAAIRLRYTQPRVHRAYRIPGGRAGMWVVAGLAICTCLFVFSFGFIPTPAVRANGWAGSLQYIAFLLIGVGVFLAVPIWFYRRALRTGQAQPHLPQGESHE